MEFKTDSNRIYYEENSVMLAEITYIIEGDKAIIDHTFVDDSLRGQGVASKLVEMAVKQIKELNLIPDATCSYAAKWLEKHSDTI